jgi:hypothetical protein
LRNDSIVEVPEDGEQRVSAFVACSRDGITWEMMPPPYPARLFGNYVTMGNQLLVMGGQNLVSPLSGVLTDVWSTRDGRTWNRIGNTFPQVPSQWVTNSTASLGELLMTVEWGAALAHISGDGGATWSAQPLPPLIESVGLGCELEQVGDELWLLGANSIFVGRTIAAFDGKSWRVLDTQLPPESQDAVYIRAATLGSCLWIDLFSSDLTPRFFTYNHTPPGTTFSLIPPPVAVKP